MLLLPTRLPRSGKPSPIVPQATALTGRTALESTTHAQRNKPLSYLSRPTRPRTVPVSTAPRSPLITAEASAKVAMVGRVVARLVFAPDHFTLQTTRPHQPYTAAQRPTAYPGSPPSSAAVAACATRWTAYDADRPVLPRRESRQSPRGDPEAYRAQGCWLQENGFDMVPLTAPRPSQKRASP